MHITVLGRGNVGGTLAGALTSAGHDVRLTGRDGAAAALAPQPDAVVVAVPGAALLDLAREHADALAGALVVDATNLVGGARFHQLPELAQVLPTARLYRAFCSVGWEVMAEPVVDGVVADLPFVGADGADRDSVAGLIRDVGARPVWLGDAVAADALDGWARVWFALALGRGIGRHLALHVVTTSTAPLDAPVP